MKSLILEGFSFILCKFGIVILGFIVVMRVRENVHKVLST